MVAGQNDVNDPIQSRAKKHGRRQAIGSRGYRCRQHFRHIGHSNQGRSTPGMLCASQRGGLLPSSADGAQLRRVGLALIENDNTSPSLPWRWSFRRPEDSTAGRLCIPLRESRRLRDTPLTNHSDNHRYRTVQCLATGKPSQRTSAAARVHADCRQRHVYGAHGHADMILRSTSLAPNKTLSARVGTECTSSRLTSTIRLRVVLLRLSANIGGYTDMITRTAGFTPDKAFLACVWAKITDRMRSGRHHHPKASRRYQYAPSSPFHKIPPNV
jgi:hypothetical protein